MPRGGGIFTSSGTATVINSTISGNTATQSAGGGGVSNSGLLIIGGSAITGNDAFSGGGISNSGTAALINSTVSGNMANNGGPILTYALASSSPAVDTSPDDALCEPTDQRGVPRPQGAAYDIRAYELGGTPPPVCGDTVVEALKEPMIRPRVPRPTLDTRTSASRPRSIIPR